MIRRLFRRLCRKTGLFQDGLQLRGDVEFCLWDKEGKLKDHRYIKNLVTNLGCAYIADKCSGDIKNAMKWMAVGKGVGQTADKKTLKTEDERTSCGVAKQGTGANDHKFIFTGTFGTGKATAALKEAGVFNKATAGTDHTMFCYLTYAVINKGSKDTLTITWTLSVADDGA